VNISNSHPHVVGVEPCYVRWDRTEWHQTRQVRITAVQNYRTNAGESYQVHLNAQVLSMASYYNGFDVQDFFIETINRRTAQCRATGDPHYTTFDGYYWHYYQASTVTLYESPFSSSLRWRERATVRACSGPWRECERATVRTCSGPSRECERATVLVHRVNVNVQLRACSRPSCVKLSFSLR
jgi:hypothetical protein